MTTLKKSEATVVNPLAVKPSSLDEKFRFVVQSIKREITAAGSFQRFINLSTIHSSPMLDNIDAVRTIFLKIIFDLLASFKFTFNRTNFTQITQQMCKFDMNDHYYWTIIINEAKTKLEKYFHVNKTKYEDLIKFFHMAYDHINKSTIELDLPTNYTLCCVKLQPTILPSKFSYPSKYSSSLGSLSSSSISSSSISSSSISSSSSPSLISTRTNSVTDIESIQTVSLDDSLEEQSTNFTIKTHNIQPRRLYKRPVGYITLPELKTNARIIPLNRVNNLPIEDPRKLYRLPIKIPVDKVQPPSKRQSQFRQAKTKNLPQTKAKRQRIVWDL